MNSDNHVTENTPPRSIQVRVYYSYRESANKRLATFTVPDDTSHGDGLVPISLKQCLWAICSLSPDMICKEHDLSIYTMHQEALLPKLDNDNPIWEGHGLMSWIMDQHDNDISVHGKRHASHDQAEIHVELQPTLTWTKHEFYTALKKQNFANLKLASRSSISPHNCRCGYPPSALAPLPAHTSPLSVSTDRSIEFDLFLKQKQLSPSPSSSNSNQSFSPPTQSRSLSLPSTSRMLPPMNLTMTRRPAPAVTVLEPPLQGLSHPAPAPALARRHSLFKPVLDRNVSEEPTSPVHLSMYSTSISESHNALDQVRADPEIWSGSIPVIYTPSNKKRRKHISMEPTTPTTPTLSSPMSPKGNQPVRTYYEVERDAQGNCILPIEIDSWTVVDLGSVVYDRPAYHNQRYIYPVNYTVRKWYRSMVDPTRDTQYTCRILDNGPEPKFEVTADDCPATYSGPTPTTVWTIVVRRAFSIRNQEYGHNPVGPDFFGLRKNTIAKIIQDLPGATHCSQYIWQIFEPVRTSKSRRNRRRISSSSSGVLLGRVNYSLTSSRTTHRTIEPAQPALANNSH